MPKEKVYAVFGVSVTDPTKYGTRIYRDMRLFGYDAYAINPKGGELDGRPVYKTLADLPQKADCAIMVLPPNVLVGAVEQCIKGGVKQIYFQPGARDEKAKQLAEQADIETVESCFMADNGIW